MHVTSLPRGAVARSYATVPATAAAAPPGAALQGGQRLPLGPVRGTPSSRRIAPPSRRQRQQQQLQVLVPAHRQEGVVPDARRGGCGVGGRGQGESRVQALASFLTLSCSPSPPADPTQLQILQILVHMKMRTGQGAGEVCACVVHA